jgi:uncharacterized protein YrrD
MNDREQDRITMMALPLSVIATIAAVAIGTFAAMAQTPPAETAQAPSIAVTRERDIVGMPVQDKDGKAVGYVTRVDRAPSGQVERVEISSGGFLGFGARSLLVAPDRVETGKDEVTLLITYDEFQRQLR